MTFSETIRQDYETAFRSKDMKRVGTLRLLMAAIKNREIEERKKEVGLADAEILSVIHKEVKKRKDAIVEFEKAGRGDLVDNEKAELDILEKYLPAELPDEEIRRVIQDGIRELGGGGDINLGALMKIVMPVLKSHASGDRISKLAKEELEKL